MNFGTYVVQLLPETIVGGAAFVVLLLGVSRNISLRTLAAPMALTGILLALLTTVLGGHEGSQAGAPGLLFTSLTFYVRLITLGMGVLLVWVNWHLPEPPKEPGPDASGFGADANPQTRFGGDREQGEFFALLLLSLVGLMLTASANDLIALFFAIELVSVPAYVMVALSRSDIRAPESAVKYFFLGALSAAFLLYGFSFIYGVAGTTVLNAPQASITAHFARNPTWGSYAVIGMLLAFAGLAFKIAAVPFHVYAPDVYEGAAAPVTGFLGFVPKFAGFVALIKLLSVTGWEMPPAIGWTIWAVAAATMTTGNVLALLQSNVKRVLAYSSIAHTGYMLIGLLVGPVAGKGPMGDGLAAMLFYMAVYGTMNLGAFAVLAALRARGEEAEKFDDLAGLHQRYPGLALALAVCAFSLMGFPLTAGFLGKVYIFSSAFSLGGEHPFGTPLVVLAVIGVINSAIGAAYYLRIAAVCYLRPLRQPIEARLTLPLQWGLASCSLLMVILFLWPNGLTARAQLATRFLHTPTGDQQALVSAGMPSDR